MTKPVGAALVLGGGIGGIQASLDLADSGYKVYLVENKPCIGGRMAQLDKTFPTNDCAMCIMAPKLVDCGRHPNIEIITCAEIEKLKGGAGNFTVSVKKNPRFVDEEKCTGCGSCEENCPVRYQIYEPEAIKVELDRDTEAKMKQILGKFKDQKGILLPLLHEVNTTYNYLPENTLRYISKELRTPLSLVYQISTFYNAFSLKPKAKFTIYICMGTACYVKGGGKIVEAFERELKIKAGATTPDLLFGLEATSCFGCCGQAPVIMVNEDLYGHFKITKVPKLLEKCQKEVKIHAKVTA